MTGNKPSSGKRGTETEAEMVIIAEIGGTHGYNGEIKIIPVTDFPERFNDLKRVWAESRKQKGYLEVESVRRHKQYLLMKFTGYDEKETAAHLTGGVLKVPENEIFPLPEGVYYIFQLENLSVYDEKRGLLGQLKEVLQTGANDVYVVNGGPFGEVLIPAIKNVILGVDLEAGRMEVSLLPGLIDGEDE